VQPLAIGLLREASQAEIPSLFSNLAIGLLRIRTQGRCRHRGPPPGRVDQPCRLNETRDQPLRSGGQKMPLVRINLSKDYSSEQRGIVSDVVYAAMTEIANVPEHDKFQIFTPHSDGELVYPKNGYLGIDYTPKIIFIQVFWVAGRTTDVKKAFYRRIADDLHTKIGVRKQDVWITLADNAREDWSFGNGEMQYAPK
jgi:4-oxalocrotonate tautomerase